MTHLPQITCPVCDDCDHDVRAGILKAIAQVGENLRFAGDKLLDACETEGAAQPEFGWALLEFESLKRQLSALEVFTIELAAVKADNA